MNKFHQIIKPIYGEKCTHVGRWFGTMILIDFGKLHPPTAGQKFGRYDWSISINDSWWEMSKKDNVIVGNGDTEVEIDKKIKQILGKTIVNIQTSTNFSQTTFTFDDDLYLTCKHKPSNKFEDWSISTPEDMYIRVGPKHKWLYTPGTDKTNW